MPDFEKNMDRSWSTTTEELISKNRKFQNFWTVTLPSLQHGWIISIARLMDEAYFDPKKNTKPNLSFKYILAQLNDAEIDKQVETRQVGHKKFIDSILDWRNKYVAHNDINFSEEKINKGFEDYVEFLLKCIEEIKHKHPHLKDCSQIDLAHIEKISEAGVGEIFQKLVA